VKEWVVDASVAIKWFIPEIHSDAARRLRSQDFRLHVPRLFDLEVGNILCKKIRRKELALNEAEEILGDLRQMPLLRHLDEPLTPLAFRLANTTRRSLYDSLYVALALTMRARFVTSDQKLCRALAKTAWETHLCWVEDIP